MMKPNTAFKSAAMNDAPKVSRYAASARGSVAMRQNSSNGRLAALMINAANGISTIADRNNVAKPSVNPNPGSTLGLTHPRAAAIMPSCDSSAAPRLGGEEQPVVNAAVVEVHGLRLAPAAR